MRKKNQCVYIVVWFEAECCNLVTGEGQVLIWANDIRYLGVYIVSSSSFKCLLTKRSFYRSFNAIFGKVGRIDSNEVIVQLIKTKCFPVLYDGLEACPLRKSQFSSLNYVINSTFRKVFDTRSQDAVVLKCLTVFRWNIQLRCVRRNFWKKVSNSSNMRYQKLAAEAVKELVTL